MGVAVASGVGVTSGVGVGVGVGSSDGVGSSLSKGVGMIPSSVGVPRKRKIAAIATTIMTIPAISAFLDILTTIVSLLYENDLWFVRTLLGIPQDPE